MAYIVNLMGAGGTLQNGINFNFATMGVGVRYRSDGTIAAEGRYGLASVRGAYNPYTGEYGGAAGVSYDLYNRNGIKTGIFIGIGLDKDGFFMQITGTINATADTNHPVLSNFWSGVRIDYKFRLNVSIDPLVIDLDGDGIELTALGVAGQEGASGIHFDYDRDGFGERTAWVKADDGLLAIDDNGNGLVDGIGELFGSPSQDGFAVLETLDTNHDGVISAGDREFSKLRIWRDLNQNGATDAGELQTLDEAGITSISLSRSDVTGTNAGNDRGFQSTVTFAGGATRIAESIYFQTDRAATADTTPEFTLAEGVDLLPQLGGSGQIHSLAWKASTDAAFRAEWTAAR